MTVDRGRTEHPEEPAEGGREKGEETEVRVREEQQNERPEQRRCTADGSVARFGFHAPGTPKAMRED
ncbi:hypothetical protein [Lentzea sp. E54]|uniref:hypothetical protein n=1 Tax=Lentzea xerophila TaxID=3435883 RepID=UPI003DA5F7DF